MSIVSWVLNLPVGAKGESWTGTLGLTSSSSSLRLRFFFNSLSFGSTQRTEKGHSALLASSMSRGRLRGAAIWKVGLARGAKIGELELQLGGQGVEEDSVESSRIARDALEPSDWAKVVTGGGGFDR